MRKRMTALLLCLMMALIAGLSSAAADDAAWTCTNCGQTNTGNYCSNCAAPRPSAEWLCPNCGQLNTGNFCTNCAAARPSGGQAQQPEATAAPVTVNDQLEQIPGEANHVKVRVRSVDGDPYIQNAQDASRWVPQNAADGDETTCWQFSSGGKKTLSKNWLKLNLSAPQRIDALWFKSGFWGYSTTGKDQYPLNSRPKNIKVDFLYQGAADYSDTIDITLSDDKLRQNWQAFDVGRHDNVIGVRIRVITYYTGSQFPKDICLSEVMLVQNASAAIASTAQATNPPTYYEAPRVPSQANLLDKLATRSGPATEYEEPGTFFQNNWREKTVRVTGKQYDGSIWWVEVDFEWKNNTWYRVWTGLKRVDVDLNLVQEARRLGTCSVNPCDAWYGPGGNYAKAKSKVLFREDLIDIYGRENGYYQVDFYDVNREFQRRIWVPESAVSNVVWY